jgi:hypothetical protein
MKKFFVFLGLILSIFILDFKPSKSQACPIGYIHSSTVSFAYSPTCNVKLDICYKCDPMKPGFYDLIVLGWWVDGTPCVGITDATLREFVARKAIENSNLFCGQKNCNDGEPAEVQIQMPMCVRIYRTADDRAIKLESCGQARCVMSATSCYNTITLKTEIKCTGVTTYYDDNCSSIEKTWDQLHEMVDFMLFNNQNHEAFTLPCIHITNSECKCFPFDTF